MCSHFGLGLTSLQQKNPMLLQTEEFHQQSYELRKTNIAGVQRSIYWKINSPCYSMNYLRLHTGRKKMNLLADRQFLLVQGSNPLMSMSMRIKLLGELLRSASVDGQEGDGVYPRMARCRR